MNNTHCLLFASMTLGLVSCTTAMTAKPEQPAPPASAQEAAAAPIARRTGFAAASDGARIYYEVCGSGPAIVFVHGLGGNHAVWFHQVAHFAKNRTVITMSQCGFAPSGGDQTHYNVELLTRDLASVMDAAGVERAVLVGQSMGGWTVLEFALRLPARVESLVLADTLGGIDDEKIAAHRKEIAASAARLRSEPPPLGVHPALSAAFSRQHPELGYLYQTLNTFGAPAADSIVKQLFAAKVGKERLHDLRVPTLFVVGSEDKLFPPLLLEHASAYIDGARLEEIAGAGHSPYFEQPAAWNAVVESFVRDNRGSRTFAPGFD